MRLDFFKLFTSFVLVTNPIVAQAPSIESQIEEMMEIHYIRPEMKSPYDKVEVNANEAHLSIWRDLPPDPDSQKTECVGYQWLLTGRGQKLGQGAAEVFKALPQLQKISLELVEIEFELRSVDGKGKYKKVPVSKPYLKMVAERSRILEMNRKNSDLRKELQKDLSTCLKVGREWITEKEIR